MDNEQILHRKYPMAGYYSSRTAVSKVEVVIWYICQLKNGSDVYTVKRYETFHRTGKRFVDSKLCFSREEANQEATKFKQEVMQ